MSKNLEEAALSISKNADVAEKLSQLLAEPGDRAYIICTSGNCSNNAKGECTIYTVLGVRKTAGMPCKEHKPV